MSNNKKNNKKKKNINNYSIETLEPRLMMNADTAEIAANEYITTAEFVSAVIDNVEELKDGNIQIGSDKLSVSKLLNETFSNEADNIVLTQTSDADWYSVSLNRDLALNKSFKNLSVNVGHEVSALNAQVNTTVKINDLKLKIEKADDGSYSVKEKQLKDVGVSATIITKEAENALVNDGYLALVEKKEDQQQNDDLKIEVNADTSSSNVTVNYDFEFDADSSVVMFQPDMKVTSPDTNFSYTALTLKTSNEKISNIETIVTAVSEYIKNFIAVR